MRLINIELMGASLDSMPVSTLAETGEPSLCVFGYGSLLWKTGFVFEKQYRALVRGYSRRFYQGNTTFRGTEDLPGRVVTLIEDEKSETYGLIFQVIGWRNVFDTLEHLYEREIENGYAFRVVNVECVDTNEVVQALTCIAFKQNVYFLGPPQNDDGEKNRHRQFDQEEQKIDNCQERRTRRDVAMDIARARGIAGPNYEYLLKLADSMRQLFPHVVDEDLYQLEAYVMTFLNEAK